MVYESADPATCLQGQGAILIVHVARDLAGKRGSSVVVAVSDKGLLGGLGCSGLAGLMPLILLLEYAYELLVINVLFGVCVDKVKLTSNKLIGVLVP